MKTPRRFLILPLLCFAIALAPGVHGQSGTNAVVIPADTSAPEASISGDAVIKMSRGDGTQAMSSFRFKRTAAAVLGWDATGRAAVVPWSMLTGQTGATGSPGSNGTNGSNGAAATLAAGTATVLPVGSTPTVSNSGTPAAAVFNFGIPAGAVGPIGPQGPAGVNATTTAVATPTAAGLESAADKAKLDAFPSYSARGFSNSPARPLVAVAAAANGFQVSAGRDTLVSYSVSISTTATIGGAASGQVVLEVCPTNSATAASWAVVATAANGQSLTLAAALNSVQTTAHTLVATVPAGYYARLRTVNVSGTPTFGFVCGQEVLLGP